MKIHIKDISFCQKPGQRHETGYAKPGWPAGLPGKPGGPWAQYIHTGPKAPRACQTRVVFV